MESCNTLEILQEDTRRREENKHALVNGLDAINQPRTQPEYEVGKTKLRLKTLVPLAKNTLYEMRMQDWRALQVTINTSGIPPKDDISLA